MLNRWLEYKKEEEMIGRKKKKPSKPQKGEKRPYLASMAETLTDAEYWRSDLLRELGITVMELQNDSLEEHKVRDLNDHANKLIRTKFHWNHRIKELGGPDYQKTSEPGAENAIRAP